MLESGAVCLRARPPTFPPFASFVRVRPFGARVRPCGARALGSAPPAGLRPAVYAPPRAQGLGALPPANAGAKRLRPPRLSCGSRGSPAGRAARGAVALVGSTSGKPSPGSESLCSLFPRFWSPPASRPEPYSGAPPPPPWLNYLKNI